MRRHVECAHVGDERRRVISVRRCTRGEWRTIIVSAAARSAVPVALVNVAATMSGMGLRLAAIEARLTEIGGELGSLSAALDARPAAQPREQERLEVDAKPKAKAKRAPRKKSS
mgnify:CR=1 FL=1